MGHGCLMPPLSSGPLLCVLPPAAHLLSGEASLSCPQPAFEASVSKLEASPATQLGRTFALTLLLVCGPFLFGVIVLIHRICMSRHSFPLFNVSSVGSWSEYSGQFRVTD